MSMKYKFASENVATLGQNLSRYNFKHINELKYESDLKSLHEAIDFHYLKEMKREYVESWVTTDSTTRQIYDEIAKENPWISQLAIAKPSVKSDMFKQNIVEIEHFNGTALPQYQKIVEEFEQSQKQRYVAIGGPSALSSAAIMSQFAQDWEIFYFNKNHSDSNSFLGARQMHSRMSASYHSLKSGQITPHFIKETLIKDFLRLLIFFTDSTYLKHKLIEMSLNRSRYPNYIDIDTIWIQDYILAFLYSFYGHRNGWRHKKNKPNDYENDFRLAKINTEIVKFLEQKYNTNITFQTNKTNHENEKNLTYDITFTEMHKNRWGNFIKSFANKYNPDIVVYLLQKNDRAKIYRDREEMFYTFTNNYDTACVFDDYFKEVEQIKKNKGVVQENTTLKKIYVKPQKNDLKLIGLEFEDLTNKSLFFVPCTKLCMSLGYQTNYRYQNKTLMPFTSVATAVSSNIILKKNSDQILNRLSTGYMCHTTPICETKDYLLIRMTNGSNYGMANYKPAQFFNLMSKARCYYGENLIGIVSTAHACRMINSKNSTRHINLGKNITFSYGKSGTGMTKKQAEAFISLKYLGLDHNLQELKNYCKDLEKIPFKEFLYKDIQNF